MDSQSAAGSAGRGLQGNSKMAGWMQQSLSEPGPTGLNKPTQKKFPTGKNVAVIQVWWQRTGLNADLLHSKLTLPQHTHKRISNERKGRQTGTHILPQCTLNRWGRLHVLLAIFSSALKPVMAFNRLDWRISIVLKSPFLVIKLSASIIWVQLFTHYIYSITLAASYLADYMLLQSHSGANLNSFSPSAIR